MKADGDRRAREDARFYIASEDEGMFDFVYSSLTFQHMPAPVVETYCREVRRVLAPRGRIRFQVLNFERSPRPMTPIP